MASCDCGGDRTLILEECAQVEFVQEFVVFTYILTEASEIVEQESGGNLTIRE